MTQTNIDTYRPVEPKAGNRFYQQYTIEEDTERTAYHYEHAPEFFLTFINSKWHSYSCVMWEDNFTATQAEEKKFNKFAELMELKPGMRILDVGFGWGGPLVYLCKQYDVQGHGITIAQSQIPTAQARATKHGVDAQFDLIHWKNLPDVPTYDAIPSDEVITHFFDLKQFFAKCHKILKPSGVMVHKELHLTRSEYGELGPLSQHVNELYGYTGNYRTLYDELRWLDETGFSMKNIHQIPITNYHRTVDHWMSNLFANRAQLKDITSPKFYKDFRAYLKAVRYIFTRETLFTMDMIASRKVK